MRKYLLAAAAAAAIASPAVARDGSGYFGVEGGALFPQDKNVDFSGTYTYSEGGTYDFVADAKINYKTGIDLDLIAGYDFGMFRLEGELGWKKAKHSSYDNATLIATSSEGDTYTYGPYDADADGKTTVLSAMVNALLDFGDENGLSFYAGGGVGWAQTKVRISLDSTDTTIDDLTGSAKDSGFAWQGIAGVRYALSPNIDLGLKYRYFRGPSVKESEVFAPDASVSGTFDARTRFSSHSLLASLIYNFAAPPPPPPPPLPPPPPPPPPPPATQTCPDGSVILATDACPVPPPPPPPPPPAPERG